MICKYVNLVSKFKLLPCFDSLFIFFHMSYKKVLLRASKSKCCVSQWQKRPNVFQWEGELSEETVGCFKIIGTRLVCF